MHWIEVIPAPFAVVVLLCLLFLLSIANIIALVTIVVVAAADGGIVIVIIIVPADGILVVFYCHSCFSSFVDFLSCSFGLAAALLK
jgi:hypothetical protein